MGGFTDSATRTVVSLRGCCTHPVAQRAVHFQPRAPCACAMAASCTQRALRVARIARAPRPTMSSCAEVVPSRPFSHPAATSPPSPLIRTVQQAAGGVAARPAAHPRQVVRRQDAGGCRNARFGVFVRGNSKKVGEMGAVFLEPENGLKIGRGVSASGRNYGRRTAGASSCMHPHVRVGCPIMALSVLHASSRAVNVHREGMM